MLQVCWSPQTAAPGAQIQTPSPPLQNRHVPAFILSTGNPTLELCPHRCFVNIDSSCFQNCTDRLDGTICLITIRISDFFLPVFSSTTNGKLYPALIQGNNLLICSTRNLTVESVCQNWGIYIITVSYTHLTLPTTAEV